MKKSGEHRDDPYDFVEVALKKATYKKLLGVFPLYYFSMKAKICEDFDKRFQPFMSEILKGDCTTEFESMSIMTSEAQRGKVHDYNEEFLSSVKNIEESQQIMANDISRNANLDELEKLEKMLKKRQSPIADSMKCKIEKRIDTLMKKLFPDEED
jgi:hypothetical protein